MARYFILALLVVFSICLMQVSAAPQNDESQEPNFQDELKKAGDKISQAFNDAKPKLEELLAKGQEFLDNFGKKISEEAGKIIPKSDENKSS
ncbi:uncharacterized protein LOC131663751 [Phymastichus coffea]|uniref:uncharacterized protein LOC131663751 n=1 Tax=Phymastichus coffea TaxID=108790 RepID=UPI00273BDC93|nr:uncharacterized protein LOC131663751 [Phymastichus coffea]